MFSVEHASSRVQLSSLTGQTSRLVGVVSESKRRLVTYVHIPRSLANIPAKPHSGTHVMQ